MMFSQSVLATALLVLPALSSPAPWGGTWGGGWGGWSGKWERKYDAVIPFTSTYSIEATPEQVVNGTTFTGGLPGTVGYYQFGVNSDLDLICYYIRLYGYRGDYVSPASTATHIHQAAYGASGPPRLAFPNPAPTGNGDERISIGCLRGPFTTGIVDNKTGADTAAGFKVAQIEAGPAGFFADVHSTLAVPGAVRGQLA